MAVSKSRKCCTLRGRLALWIFVYCEATYRQMFRGMKTLTEGVANIPKDLAVLFVSGDKDPVGDFGAGVWRVYEQYRKAGMKDVEIQLYSGDRHEILNEKDRRESLRRSQTESVNKL